MTATWSPVSDPSAPVTYTLLLQGLDGGRWSDLKQQSTQATSLRLDIPYPPRREGPFTYRWAIRAEDARGNVGNFAPWFYFLCVVIG